MKEPFSEAALGEGGRFAACIEKMEGRVDDPRAVCASIGRRVHGAERFQQLAARGRKKGAEHFGEEAEVLREIATRLSGKDAANVLEAADTLDEAEGMARTTEGKKPSLTAFMKGAKK